MINNTILAVYTLSNNKQIFKLFNLTLNNNNLNLSNSLLKSNNIIQVDFYSYIGVHKQIKKIINEFIVGNKVGLCDNFIYIKQLIVL